MAISLNTGTREVPLKLAKELSAIVSREWESGAFMSNTTPVTQDLLRYWFHEPFCDTRNFNFHAGQRQSILNTVYLHEVLKTDSVFDVYTSVSDEITAEMDITCLKKDKFSHPKYCLKMATGTGKTWVLGALLTSDFKSYEELFIQAVYKEMLFGFLQTNVVKEGCWCFNQGNNGLFQTNEGKGRANAILGLRY